MLNTVFLERELPEGGCIEQREGPERLAPALVLRSCRRSLLGRWEFFAFGVSRRALAGGGGGEVEDVVAGHSLAALILYGPVVPVTTPALHDRRVLGIGQQRHRRVEDGFRPDCVIAHVRGDRRRGRAP